MPNTDMPPALFGCVMLVFGFLWCVIQIPLIYVAMWLALPGGATWSACALASAFTTIIGLCLSMVISLAEAIVSNN